MAIVIPSKHIYSKSFDPVIDNNIDKVEATIKEQSIVESQEEVAKETITSFINGTISTIEKFNGFASGNNANATYIKVEDIKYTPTITINVDKKQENRLVKNLITGVDGNGNSNISYELFGDVQRGQIYIELQVTGSGSNLTIVSQNIDTYPSKTNIQDTTYSFPINNNHKYENSMNYPSEFKSISTNATDLSTEIEIDGGTLFSATATETENQISISFNLLVGFTLYKAALSAVEKTENTYRLLNVNAPSTFNTEYYPYFEKYVAKQVNITINGVVLSLNLEDAAIQNGDGNKVFSFDGNELIQTTNTPSIESNYQGVIDKWKNGKQTATITCPITDYYGNVSNGEKYLAITPTKAIKVKLLNLSGNIGYFQETTTRALKNGITLNLSKNRLPLVSNYNKETGKFSSLILITSNYSIGSVYEVTNRRAPFTFNIGDIVIPYTYTNKGDKPLSYNRDFTPKQFKVVGTKISKRQGGMQELTLQEV